MGRPKPQRAPLKPPSENRPKDKPKPPEPKGPRGRPPNTDSFDAIGNRSWINPITEKKETLPPLTDFVLERLVYMRRWEIVDVCMEHYKCSEKTVDKYISKAKRILYDTAGERRPQRVRQLETRLEQLYNLALKNGDLRTARLVAMDKAKLFGDIQIQQGVDVGQQTGPVDPKQMNDEQLLKRANELRNATARTTGS
jgi:hypothetical protein